MTITEFAILPFKSPTDFSDPTLHTLFGKLSDWQSDCASFPLLFFKDEEDPSLVHLVTGWKTVAEHEAWIRGERNQTLLRLFAPYVDIPSVRMVHLGIDFEDVPSDLERMVIERFETHEDSVRDLGREWKKDGGGRRGWMLAGGDLGQELGNVYCFVGGDAQEGQEETGLGNEPNPVERWTLRRVKL